jgi:hypothetical protein
MSEIVGKWIQEEGQAYEGLWFEFKPDGTFEAQYDPMGIESGGTYKINGNQIDMDQTTHTFGLIGYFKGLFEIRGNQLKMALASGSEEERPENLADARVYIKMSN